MLSATGLETLADLPPAEADASSSLAVVIDANDLKDDDYGEKSRSRKEKRRRRDDDDPPPPQEDEVVDDDEVEDDDDDDGDVNDLNSVAWKKMFMRRAARWHEKIVPKMIKRMDKLEAKAKAKAKAKQENKENQDKEKQDKETLELGSESAESGSKISYKSESDSESATNSDSVSDSGSELDSETESDWEPVVMDKKTEIPSDGSCCRARDMHDLMSKLTEEEQKKPWLAVKYPDEEIDAQFNEFYERLHSSEGFDIPFPPFPTFEAIIPFFPVDDPLIAELAQFSINTYNEAKGKSIEFIKVTKASRQAVAGYLYYLTFEAKDVDDNVGLYQAKVWDFCKKQLLLFRKAPQLGEPAQTDPDQLCLDVSTLLES